MTDKPTQVESEILERLEDPFVRSRTFGKLRWLRDESLMALVLAIIVAAAFVLLFLVGGEVIGTGEVELAKPNITVAEVVLGDGTSPLNNVADAVTPQTQQQTSSGPQPGIDAIAQFEVGKGRDLTGDQLGVAQSKATVDNVPVITLPPAPPGGGSPGSSSVTGIFKVDKNVMSVVYIIDKSGSMAGSNLSRVQAELIFAINALDETQKFSVIFFDGLAWPLYSQRGQPGTGGGAPLSMLVATAGNKTLATDWVRTMRAGGGTNPFPAVMMGLGVSPQKIFLLSDGGQVARNHQSENDQRYAGHHLRLVPHAAWCG
jgi:Mg-chelatase subunit ChlD